jgi:hypothetical protein
LKNALSLSTVIVLIPEPLIAAPVSCETLAGMQIDRSDEQSKKAELPIVDSLEPGVNSKLRRF